MVVDDDNLGIIIKDLQTKIVAKSDEKKNMRLILESAESIQLIVKSDPTPEDENHKTYTSPQDAKLKTTITDDRRNQIYDKIVSDHSQL